MKNPGNEIEKEILETLNLSFLPLRAQDIYSFIVKKSHEKFPLPDFISIWNEL